MKKLPAQLVSDSTLAACCDGDSDAWRRFVEAASPVIYAVVMRTIGRNSGASVEVNDAVQEVFLRLCRHEFRLLKTFDPSRSSLATFLRVVASSTTIDQLRRHRPTAGSDALAGEICAEVPETPFDLADVPMDVLTDRQRLILRLLFQSQMEVRNVARALNINEQTVRSSKHKALERLRAAIRERESTPAPAPAAAPRREFAGDVLTPDRV